MSQQQPKKTIRVNRVINTTSGKNTPANLPRPRRPFARRRGKQPGIKRLGININIRNILSPVNTVTAGGAKRGKGFRRTGRTAPGMRRATSRPGMRRTMSRRTAVSSVRPGMRRTVSRPGVRRTATRRPVTASARQQRRQLRMTRRANRASIRAQRRQFRAMRRTRPRKTIAGKSLRFAGKVARYHPAAIGFRAGRAGVKAVGRGFKKLFGRRRRRRR